MNTVAIILFVACYLAIMICSLAALDSRPHVAPAVLALSLAR